MSKTAFDQLEATILETLEDLRTEAANEVTIVHKNSIGQNHSLHIVEAFITRLQTAAHYLAQAEGLEESLKAIRFARTQDKV